MNERLHRHKRSQLSPPASPPPALAPAAGGGEVSAALGALQLGEQLQEDSSDDESLTFC